VNNRPLGHGRRLVENAQPLLDTRSETAHVPAVRVSKVAGKLACR
jgi:hypothetical protein